MSQSKLEEDPQSYSLYHIAHCHWSSAVQHTGRTVEDLQASNLVKIVNSLKKINPAFNVKDFIFLLNKAFNVNDFIFLLLSLFSTLIKFHLLWAKKNAT